MTKRLITSRPICATTQRKNFTATWRMRHALLNKQIVEHGDGWAVMYKGDVVATYATVGEAVASL